MKRLLPFLLFATSCFAQTVTNPSFEANPPNGSYNYAAPSGWSCTGPSYGMLNPTASQVASGVDGKTVLWLNTGATCTQDAGPAVANGNYTLTVSVGSQAGFSGKYSISYAGCSTSGTNGGTVGSLAPVTLPCQAASGDIVISLSATSGQVLFDLVTLTVPPPGPPPQFQTFTFAVQLMNCSLCTPASFTTGDWTALASASVYQGSAFTITQGTQNYCTATLNANAQASCTGPLNVAPAMLNLTYNVTFGSNVVGQAFSAPSLVVTASPSGNGYLYIGFDSKTMAPRAAFVGTM